MSDDQQPSLFSPESEDSTSGSSGRDSASSPRLKSSPSASESSTSDSPGPRGTGTCGPSDEILGLSLQGGKSQAMHFKDETPALATTPGCHAVLDRYNQKVSEGTSPTLDSAPHNRLVADLSFRTNQTGARGPIHREGVTDTLAQDHPPAVMALDTYNQKVEEGTTHTLRVSTDRGLQSTPHVLTSSSGDSRARISASPASAPASAATGRASSGRSSDSPELFGPGGYFSKTSRASFPLAAVVDAESSRDFYLGIRDEAVSAVRRALPRRRGSTPTTAPTSRWSSPPWRTSAIASATEYWTADTSESPSDAVACSLSRVLSRTVSERFYLTSRAAAGILRRAEKRGRELPPQLSSALTSLAHSKPGT